jgi:hypothetical protein
MRARLYRQVPDSWRRLLRAAAASGGRQRMKVRSVLVVTRAGHVTLESVLRAAGLIGVVTVEQGQAREFLQNPWVAGCLEVGAPVVAGFECPRDAAEARARLETGAPIQ